MVNYKSITEALDSLGYVHKWNAKSDKLIRLYITGTVNSTSKSLFDLAPVTVYQVPTGKKLIIYFLKTMSDSGGFIKLTTTTASNSTTGEVILIGISYCPLYAGVQWIETITAGLFITLTSGGTTNATFDIFGIETNA